MNIIDKAFVFYMYYGDLENYYTYDRENGIVISESFANKMLGSKVKDRLIYPGPWGTNAFVTRILPDDQMPYRNSDKRKADVLINPVGIFRCVCSSKLQKIKEGLSDLLSFLKNSFQLRKKCYITLPTLGIKEKVITDEIYIMKPDQNIEPKWGLEFEVFG